MSKRWKNVVIDGVNFAIDTKNTTSAPTGGAIRRVEDVYARPSQTKLNIFYDWQAWCVEHCGYCEVASYNCMMFTLDGMIEYEGKKYRLYISKTRHELTPIA